MRLLDRTDHGYRPSAGVQLGMRATVERGLLEVATPFLDDLYERTQETVNLGVRDRDARSSTSPRSRGHGQADIPSRRGGRLGLYRTALGKVLLALSPPELFGGVLVPGCRGAHRAPSPPRAALRQLAATG